LNNLREFRVNILHTSCRKDNAQLLHKIYYASGFEVALVEIPDNPYSQKHKGKLYCFNRAKSGCSGKIIELLKGLNNLEPMRISYPSKSTPSNIDFSLWLVGKNNFQEPFDNLVLYRELIEKVSQKQITEVTENHRQLVKCSECKTQVRQDRLASHISKTHKRKISKNDVNLIIRPKAIIENNSDLRIILNSKRGTRIQQKAICDSCHVNSSVIWHYADSNQGAVNICGRCKSTVFNRSFGKIDAMTNALQGGRFESNRRRH
jgi:hypothetical protein